MCLVETVLKAPINCPTGLGIVGPMFVDPFADVLFTVGFFIRAVREPPLQELSLPLDITIIP